jgi:hypothetical protein
MIVMCGFRSYRPGDIIEGFTDREAVFHPEVRATIVRETDRLAYEEFCETDGAVPMEHPDLRYYEALMD